MFTKKMLLNTKRVVNLHGQVLHNQLPENPPGWERSKGIRS